MTDPNAQSPDPNVPPPPPQQPAAPQPVAAAPLSPEQDVQWGSFAHLGGILGALPALIIWLVFKDRGPLTNQEGKTVTNNSLAGKVYVTDFFFATCPSICPNRSRVGTSTNTRPARS